MQAKSRLDYASRNSSDSKIRKAAEFLPRNGNTVFTKEWTQRSDFQAHLEKISDYLLMGEGIWWHDENGNIVMHDGAG